MDERPIVCNECRKAMPDVVWNHPCIHTSHNREAYFAWKLGPIGWLWMPLPRWTFWEWRWSRLASSRWLAIWRVAVRLPW